MPAAMNTSPLPVNAKAVVAAIEGRARHTGAPETT
jgi:hypothetical protein